MNETAPYRTPMQKALTVSLVIAFGSGLYVISLYNYLFFHSLVETFSVLIIFVIFVLAWNSRRLLDNHYLLFLGIGTLSAGVLELIHTFAYKGFGVFPGQGANLPTQLWIAFRYVFSLTYLAAPFFITRRFNITVVLAAYSVITSVIAGSIFLGLFPDCFVEGRGLTTFKVVSEYIIIFILLASLPLLFRERAAFDRRVLQLIVSSTLASVAAELAFTQYASVYGPANLIGHLFLLASVCLIYEAIVVTGIVEPSRLLFRNLKLSEERARESEAKYRSLFENMLNGFAYQEIVCDEEGKPVDYIFLEVNQAFERLTGLKREDILGRRVTAVLPGIEKDPADWIGIYGRVALTGEGTSFERPAEALGRWYSVSAYSPTKNYFVTIFEDITERKQAEAEVITLSEDMAVKNVELEDMNRELEAFIYSLSHDLRAPLRTMAAFVGFLFEDYAARLDDQAREYLTRIKRGSEKMSRLVEDLLNISRLSRREVARTEIDLSAVAASVVAELRESDPGRTVEVSIEEGLTASADPLLIEIILSNLIGNAWKFTSKRDDARIEIGANPPMQTNPPLRPSREGTLGKCQPLFQSSREGTGAECRPAVQLSRKGIVYYVRDNGAGFDSRYAEKMFQPFHRLHSGEDFEGTGIGLAIVERAIRRHDGRVWAEGEAGKGATIYFTVE